LNAVRALTKQLQGLGYPKETLFAKYTFADVLSATGETQEVALAAFTQTPASYRTAAFAIVENTSPGDQTDLTKYRALGAPVIFVVSGSVVEVWQVRAEGASLQSKASATEELPALFARNAEHWSPQAIHRAKAMKPEPERGTQLDFVDLGLLVAIEGEVHVKLDSLLRDTLSDVLDSRGRPAMDARLLFHATFRFLAAKILVDRGHDAAREWGHGDVQQVLHGIDRYYGLGHLVVAQPDINRLAHVWKGILQGINFRNISADDLAFVYENTFVTTEVRTALGTHSTPRQMAEHIVRRLELWRDPKRVRIYEPFAGAGVLLVAALRQVRAALPLSWTDERRHEFLTQRFSGDEIDAFACEVAKLSLILADYPNHNGWDVRQSNLFSGTTLRDRIDPNTIVICNPPFEDFDVAERSSELARHDVSKPVAILLEVLQARPAGIGFVLPASFAVEKRYQAVRALLESRYLSVELVEVPDDVFAASRTGATMLIAKTARKASDDARITLRSSEITLRDRLPFLKAGVISKSRTLTRWISKPPTGELWVPALHELWAYLANNPRLGDRLDFHRGIEWNIDQASAWSVQRARGYQPGLHSASHLAQYRLPQPVWLDCRQEHARGGALGLPWDRPKLVFNAARVSRYAWRVAAAFDDVGLVCSQQFIAAWSKNASHDDDLLAYLAVLNSPMANAFLTVFTSDQRFRLRTIQSLPIPTGLPNKLKKMVEAYIAKLGDDLFNDETHLERMLTAIDAIVLDSYELPTRLERELLGFFDGVKRPTAHWWSGWSQIEEFPGLRLSEVLRGRHKAVSGNWVGDIFMTLPDREADLLRGFLG
jgi:hypothetical protein